MKAFFAIIIYSLLFSLSGCSSGKKLPISKEEEVEVALEYLLANINSHLMASNDFLGKNTISFQQVPWQSKESFEQFKQMAQGLSGDQVYKELKHFYKNQLGSDRIIEAYRLFQRPDVVALLTKEKNDLTPENFQLFEERWRQDKNREKRLEIFDRYDNMVKISEGNILIARWVGEGLIDLIQHLGVSTIHIKRWRDNARESINFFEMQTRYFTGEVMRYTYQDFSIEDLMLLDDILSRPEIEAFYQVTHQALEFAYRQTVQKILAKNPGSIRQLRHTHTP